MNKIKFPDFKPPDVKVLDPRTPLRYLLTFFLILSGAVGLTISFYNPIYLTANFPDCLNIYIHNGCYVHSSLLYVDGVIETLNSYMLYVVSVSVGLLVLGILQPEVRRGIRSFPSKVIAAYRKVRIARDYVFAKIEYLNGESKKWRTAFNIVKSPFTLLRMAGFSPQMAITFLSIGSVAGGGLVVAEVTEGRSFSNGDSGVYLAPSDIPSTFDDKDNTLAINLGAVPVREIKLENISTGEIYKGGAGNNDASVIPSTCDATDPAKTGNAKCPAVLISGHPAVAASGDTPAFVATRIKIGTLIIEKSRCRTMTFSHIDAHSILIDANFSDGISIHTQAGTAPRRSASMGGHHTAASMSSSGGTYDRLVVSPTTSAVDGYIGTLVLSNVYSKGGGGCVFKYLDIGELKIVQNEVGHDSSLLTKEFQVLNTVLGSTWTVTNNVELILPEPAIENANP